MAGVLMGLAITGGLLLVGFLVGHSRERRHLADLDRREAATSAVIVVDVEQVPPGFAIGGGALVMGEVVIAADYFKSFLAGLRNLIGGEVKTYQTMLSRARREARLRMVEEAHALGSELVVNVRFEWSEVGPRVPSSEIFCYGTAIVPKRA
jgi:uncharacterized protein YbjQ (UPF0145 family)